MSRLLRAAWVISFVAVGCAAPRSLQLAEPMGKGRTAVALEGGLDTVRSDGRWQAGASADVSLRHGLSDETDFVFRSGTSSGTEAGVKRSISLPALPTVKLAADGRLGLRTPAMIPTWMATAGAVVQWTPSRRLHLLLSPRLSVFSVPALEEYIPGPVPEHGTSDRSLGTINSSFTLLPQLTAGVGIDVLPTVRVLAETSAMLAIPGLPNGTRYPAAMPLSAAFALQWIPAR